jgi:hypothetical protein
MTCQFYIRWNRKRCLWILLIIYQMVSFMYVLTEEKYIHIVPAYIYIQKCFENKEEGHLFQLKEKLILSLCRKRMNRCDNNL